MLLEQAIELFKTIFGDYRIASYKDIDGMYIFEAYSPKFDEMPEPKTAMDPWYYVEKATGAVGHYYPFNFNPKKFFETESVKL